MSEDDTFRILKRISKNEMEDIFVDWICKVDLLGWQERVDGMMRQHGWTWKEFTDERG